MCGIVGYIGEEQAAPLLLQGLEKLEYRGYDSAGVAVYTGEKLEVAKAKGRLKILSDMLDEGKSLKGTIGIGHTRWATHGAPSDINSHPQVSDSGKFAVVHNGIIENYLTLKTFLMDRGVTFVSETDTEVVAQLLEYYYKKYQCDILEAMIRVIHKVEGSYALGVICQDSPDELYAVRKDSPLIVGLGQGENFIASDVPAILAKTREIYRLNDNEIVRLTRSGVTVFNTDRDEVHKEPVHIDWDVSAAEKGGYEHFMFKEIMEQPKAIRDTISPRIRDGKIVLDDITLTREQVESFRRIVIVACGSAYHVGVVAKYALEQLTRIPVEVDVASEFRYRHPIIDDKALVLIISQSGETADTLAAMREAKRLGARTLSIVNVVGSSIANESDDVLYTWAGPEIAVATTKAYSTQLAVVYLLALYLAAYVLGMKLGFISCLLYLLLGAVGLPVFSGFSGGLAKLSGPTGGYLIGFLFLSLICGFFIQRFPGKVWVHAAGMVCGAAVCYLFGTAWLAVQMDLTFRAALTIGVLPYLPGDVIKIIIALMIGPLLRRQTRKILVQGL